MRIVDVEAIALSAPNPAGTDWGKAAWGAEATDGPPDPLVHWRPTQVPQPARMRPAYATGIDTTLVRIETDTGIARFVASLHCAAAAPNLHPMEFWFGQNPLGDALLREPALEVRDGYLVMPQGPGLGIAIDEGRVRALAVAG